MCDINGRTITWNASMGPVPVRLSRTPNFAARIVRAQNSTEPATAAAAIPVARLRNSSAGATSRTATRKDRQRAIGIPGDFSSSTSAAAASAVPKDPARSWRHAVPAPVRDQKLPTGDATTGGMTLPANLPGRTSLGALLLGAGPRFARDSLGPVLAFYCTWKLWGLLPGIAAATIVAVAAFWWQRRQGNTGIMPAMSLGIAMIQAAVGLASGSASAYFAPGVIANGLYGCVFIGSVLLGRPLAGVFARETYAFPPRVRDSAHFRRSFSIVSLAWGGYMLLRTGLRLILLLRSSVDVFVAVSVLTGVPCTLVLMTWSFWYPLRALRRRPELWSAGEPPSTDRAG